jgi:pyrroline-5-carboxylate reductase
VQMNKILLLGCGNMGGALLTQWLPSKRYEINVVTNSTRQVASNMLSHTSADTLTNNHFDLLVIAIKPQLINSILPQYTTKLKVGGLLLSVAAGTSIATLAQHLPHSAIVRAMPNLPAIIGKSTTGLFANEYVIDQHKVLVDELLELVGTNIWLDNEDNLDKFTAIAGSGPGYIFFIIESYMQAARDLGFSELDAKTMVLNTMSASVQLALESEKTPNQLRQEVTSKNGTTAAGLSKLMQDKQLQQLFTQCTQAAYQRAVELAIDKH